MNDADLRALVRQAVARHLGVAGRAPLPEPVPELPVGLASAAQPWQHHPSHHLYLAVVNTSDACVIEPSVGCDHCGYCKSHGH
jgi:hypothetical protein